MYAHTTSKGRCQDLDPSGLGPGPVPSCTNSHMSGATKPVLRNPCPVESDGEEGDVSHQALVLESALPKLSIFSLFSTWQSTIQNASEVGTHL